MDTLARRSRRMVWLPALLALCWPGLVAAELMPFDPDAVRAESLQPPGAAATPAQKAGKGARSSDRPSGTKQAKSDRATGTKQASAKRLGGKPQASSDRTASAADEAAEVQAMAQAAAGLQPYTGEAAAVPKSAAADPKPDPLERMVAAKHASTERPGKELREPASMARPVELKEGGLGGPLAGKEPAAGRQSVSLESGNGRVIALPAPAANVFVADPRVAEVRPASTSSLFVFGVSPGRTTIAAMNAEGQPIVQYEVTVRPSTFSSAEAELAVNRLLPNSRVRVSPQARGLLLTGSVVNAADAARAVSILKGFVGKEDQVENQLSVQSSVQVNLRVRVIEMNRNVTRALGVDWQQMAGSLGRFGVTSALTSGLGALPGASTVGSLLIGSRDVNALISALAQDNLVRILAEPNLTVMSGQAGSFLAGGEFPVPVGQALGGITIEFKKFGISLAVVPTVMSDGRINLNVSPEVSQLTDQGSIKLAVGNSTISIPALTVRRAQTSVELGSGQSFAIAGLLQDQLTQASTAVPLLGEIPILGSLFRSSSFQRQETELVILVTPYVVRPVDDPSKLHTPAEGFTAPNDLERILLLRQSGQPAGVSRANAGARIPGAAGFVVQ